MPTATETCENCGRTIGRLETPHIYKQHVVCATCYGHLSAAPAAVPRPVVPRPQISDGTPFDVLTDQDVVSMPPALPPPLASAWRYGDQSAYSPASGEVGYDPDQTDVLAMPLAYPAVPSYGVPRQPKYVDNLAGVRLICLLVGLILWPLLLVWLALGVYHLIMKSRV